MTDHTDTNPTSNARISLNDDSREWTQRTGFCPLPRDHPRRWTPERQRLFIETLSITGCVKTAADTAGMSRESAYHLRRRTDARAFAEAWEDAIQAATQILTDIAFDRAINGSIERTYNADGELVSERHRTNDRLLQFLLQHHRSSRYGRLQGVQPVNAQALEDEPVRVLPARNNAIRRTAERAGAARAVGDAAPSPADANRASRRAAEVESRQVRRRRERQKTCGRV